MALCQGGRYTISIVVHNFKSLGMAGGGGVMLKGIKNVTRSLVAMVELQFSHKDDWIPNAPNQGRSADNFQTRPWCVVTTGDSIRISLCAK